MSPSSYQSPPKPKRRLLQFGLRAFLLLVTIFSIWLGLHVRSARRQQSAVAAIEAMGGRVFYDYQADGQGTFSASRASWVPQPILNRFGRDYFHNVVGIDAIGVSYLRYPKTLRRMASELRAALPGVPRLRWLHLDHELATDEVKTAARQLPRIEQVSIETYHGAMGGVVVDLDLSR